MFANYEAHFNFCIFRTQDEGSQTRIVRQFQYTAWPDPGVPQNAAPLLTFIKRVRKENGNDAGPMIVHCR